MQMQHQLTNVYFRQNVCKLLTVALYIILFYPLTCLTHFLETKGKIQLFWNMLLVQVVLFILSDSNSSQMIAHFSVCIQRMRPVSVHLSWGNVAWYSTYRSSREILQQQPIAVRNALTVNLGLYIALWIYTKRNTNLGYNSPYLHEELTEVPFIYFFVRICTFNKILCQNT
jgi:hypothetical protein